MTGVPGLRIIAAASRLVPEARRAAWRAEWEAEATYAWRRSSPSGRPGAGVALERARLRWRVMMCVFDALSESMENVTMTGLSNDVRFALRGLLRRPGFTAVAVLTLSLGIGATTAVFTLLDGVVLSPLPYENPDQLIQLEHADIRRDGQNELSISPGLYVVYRDHARTLSAVAMHSPTVLNLVVDGEAERVEGREVTPSFFEVLGVSAARGRTFVEAEGRPGFDPVIVLSDGLWAARFGSNPNIIGATVDMDGVAREVVGVMPPGFGFPDQDARFWIPLPVDDASAPMFVFLPEGIARMREGQTLATTRAEIEGLFARLTDIAPPGPGRQFLQGANIGARISSLKESLVGDLQSTLWILFATVGIVLLIACANVANLLLVRAEARQRELALRVALGAGRLQVLRTFMGESLALALAGGALGAIVAAVAVRLTTSMLPTDLPRMAEIGVDARVLGFTAAVALACALFFGLFPLIRYSGKDLAGQLREGGGARGATGGRERHRLRNGLVVSQIALALVLLIGSGLMMRSFLALRAVDPGFDPEHVLTARVSLPEAEVADWQAVEQFYRQLRGQLEAQPGITDVGLVTGVPLANDATCAGVSVEDQPPEPGELGVAACWVQAGAGYFEAMRIPVVQGRGFEPGDGADGFRAVVVSEAFAAKWWPNASPLGRRMRRGAPDEEWYTIVGVVDNIRQDQLEEVGQQMVYFPLVVDGNGPVRAARTVDVVIRTTGDPLVLVSMLRDQVRALNPRIPIEIPRAMTDVFESATARTSFTAAMLGAASGIALLLGLVGIYGVISYVVSQRTREIGVRMALGASGAAVRRMVVRQALMLSGTGVAVGLVAAALLSRVLGSMLYGVGAIDPLTYVVLALALIGAAVLACLIPAVRAASVDPSHALRAE